MTLLGWVIFIFALLFSIMLHEFGHFVTAKKFRMKVTQFFVGFGQTLWSTIRGETEYGVKAMPAGGFVKIVGMTALEDVDPADEVRSFRRQPGWQRMIVLAAGSFMHFLLAFVLLFILAVGIGQAADQLVAHRSVPSSRACRRARPRPPVSSPIRRRPRPSRASAPATRSSRWRASRCTPGTSWVRRSAPSPRAPRWR